MKFGPFHWSLCLLMAVGVTAPVEAVAADEKVAAASAKLDALRQPDAIPSQWQEMSSSPEAMQQVLQDAEGKDLRSLLEAKLKGAIARKEIPGAA